MATIYTVGHSNVSSRELMDLLSAHGIKLVIDVRSEPYSKYASQFNKREIEQELKENGFDYAYMGDSIGGKPSSPGFYTPSGAPDYEKIAESSRFKSAIAEVESLAEQTTLALMCSEADPRVCHRERLLAWVLRSHGHEVRHILQDGSIASEDQAALL